MTIAVNTRFLIPGSMEGFGHYVRELFLRITSSHSEHSFILIFDRDPDYNLAWPPNVRAVVTGPPARHPLLWKIWYDYRVPVILRKFGADLFVSADGFCSLRTKVPQCLVVHDLDFLHHPRFNKRSHIFYYKRYTPKCLAKASAVVTVSEFSRKDILAHYPFVRDKLDVIYNGIREGFRTYTYEEKMEVKKSYTGGSEYFLYAGAIHPRKNLLNLFKAFSLFKKRQKSSMKLVIAGRAAWMSESLIASLDSYRYRNDVVLTGYLPEKEFIAVMASAYALVYPSLLEGFGLPVAEAMGCGVPVITSRHSAMEEITPGAALLADVTDPVSIAEQMMLLYKDENLRAKLGERGLELSKKYDWDRSASLFWETMIKAAALKS